MSSRASSQTDTLQQQLQNVVVVGYQNLSPIRRHDDGRIEWDMRRLSDLPQIMGNTDPLHLTQSLPGVQTNNEYDSGLHIHGGESQHHAITISGVPVYNASHLLGFFSVFNPCHYDEMSLTKHSSSSSLFNRLGGQVSMSVSPDIPDRTSGELTVGPMSSQGTVKMKIDDATSLRLSARFAYMNLLYGHWLKNEDQQYTYSFDDYNATLIRSIEGNQLSFNAYFGHDRLGMHENNFQTNASLRWGNYMFSLENKHEYRHHALSAMIYTTSYQNNLSIKFNQSLFHLPSRITDYGLVLRDGNDHLQGGLSIVYHDIKPQHPHLENFYNTLRESSSYDRSRNIEITSSLLATVPVSNRWSFIAGLKPSIFIDVHHTSFFSFDPYLQIHHDLNKNLYIRMNANTSHQYLFQTGFSSLGLPTEFWMSADRHHKPQSSVSISGCLNWQTPWKSYRATFETYYNRLYHQLEYNNDLLSFINTVYDLNKSLLYGDGESYGLSLTIHKTSGRLTGWLSYGFGRSFRWFDDPRYESRYPANHERIHELNGLFSWHVGKHWNVSSIFVAASGTPFTAPTSFYVYNGNMVSEYGDHNGNRLNAYIRLDLSVSYWLVKRRTRERGLSFSLYNVTSHRNDLFYRLKLHEDQYGYRPVHFAADILPSVSYFEKF